MARPRPKSTVFRVVWFLIPAVIALGFWIAGRYHEWRWPDPPSATETDRGWESPPEGWTPKPLGTGKPRVR